MRHLSDPDLSNSDVAGGDVNWESYGRTYDEQHSSPLTQINSTNIQRLGLSASLDLPNIHNGATVPLAVGGIVYFTVGQSVVHAVDASSGRLLWRFDPKAAAAAGHKLRFSWGARGIAYWQHKLYVGTIDGRLIAINASSGREIWSVMTVDRNDVRSITGAPRVFKGMVVIGNGGADFGAVRGYVSAYDANTGAKRWRFYTVPGNPADGFESEALARAATTWKGEWWKYGGGGTVWNAITYDPDLNAVYIGTGNGSPWNQKIRSPGGGDNWYLCSVVALDADTGKYRWHYQTTPGESWDYNSTMDIVLATVPIDGKLRRVIFHAPKNGFFYVIDRATGKLISAEKLADKMTWASHVDLTTGRPVEIAGARYESGEALIWPGGIGTHNWQPMSYNAGTGLVYVPTMNAPGYYNDRGIDPSSWRDQPGRTNFGVNPYTQDGTPSMGTSALVAWNPMSRKEAWRISTPGLWNGGTMTTNGNLVFQGQADGKFVAYSADRGQPLWNFDAHMGISGAPITFATKGRQYIAVVAGWGGSGIMLGSMGAQHGWAANDQVHRLLLFRLDATQHLPPSVPASFATPVDDPTFNPDPSKVARGEKLYAQTCIVCHGPAAVAAGYAPDLRASGIPLARPAFESVVLKGSLVDRGMPKYDELTGEEIDSLLHYIRSRARAGLNSKSLSTKP